jgi:hypothetical protein
MTPTPPTPTSAPTGLKTLPLELKQQIFKEVFEAHGNDIQIGVSFDGTTLRFPALDTVKKLEKVDEKLGQEARAYLFSPLHRFVFDGDLWSHRYVLRAFMKQVPHADRKTITHAHLSTFTVLGYYANTLAP